MALRSKTRDCLSKRTLAEGNKQRVAELAIINSVQEGLAAKLDMQPMYELVGEKIHHIFDVPDIDDSLLGSETPIMVHFPFTIRKGKKI